MADGHFEHSSSDSFDLSGADGCVNALHSALTMLKSCEGENSPSLAEIMRLVRVMDSQPEHAMNRLKEALRHEAETPSPEKIRSGALIRLGHTETSLTLLSSAERAAFETAVAEELRLHDDLAGLPAQHSPSPPAHPSF